MRKLILSLSAVALTVPAAMPISTADAQTRHVRKSTYHGRVVRHHKVCRRSPGHTGMIVGGVAGALAGPGIIGHGLLGSAAGAVGGVFAGRAIDRTITARQRCYYR